MRKEKGLASAGGRRALLGLIVSPARHSKPQPNRRHSQTFELSLNQIDVMMKPKNKQNLSLFFGIHSQPSGIVCSFESDSLGSNPKHFFGMDHHSFQFANRWHCILKGKQNHNIKIKICVKKSLAYYTLLFTGKLKGAVQCDQKKIAKCL